MINIGILGIQGAYVKHAEMIRSLGAETTVIRYKEQLQDIQGLIIPGGESTAFTKQLSFKIALSDLVEFSRQHAVFGTCAGLIIMGEGIDDPRVQQMNILHTKVERNAYGSQIESFTQTITIHLDNEDVEFPGIFIRAPRIQSVGVNVRVLASLNGQPVIVEEGKHLAAAFHPELTQNDRIHRYFLQKVQENL